MASGFTEEWLAEYQARQGKDAFQELIESKGFNPIEDVDHLVVVKYLDIMGLLFHHSPLEGKRSKAAGAKLKKMGTKAGFPDFIIFDAPPLHPCAKGVVIEQKRTKGGRTSDEQTEWIEQLERRGWIAAVLNGANETIEFLRQIGWRIEGAKTQE